jgi:hypothetical protein
LLLPSSGRKMHQKSGLLELWRWRQEDFPKRR